jgi:alginate O-acetyltransferase complex protein AlgI
MLFNSFSFLIFLPLVVFGYYVLPSRLRVWWLLLASCYFYMAFVPVYIVVLAALIVVDYSLAFKIQDSPNKKFYLVLGIFSNLALLFVFKYFTFFTGVTLSLLLPLGLSFHTFQSLSYLIEVYKGTWQPERHFGYYALYVMFFPQLVAGPIERPAHLLPQLHLAHSFKWERIVSGARLILWGFFLKVVVADRAAVLVDHIYKDPAGASGPMVIVGLILFAFQLYGDFAGYTEIARGSARMLGIELVLNFRRPYFSHSIGEFWQRWHISLSSWLRDYVYYPFIGWRGISQSTIYLSILITFLLSGLWHGAGWTFVLMGLWYGTLIVLEHVTHWRERLWSVVNIATTFALVCVGWAFFRAPDLTTFGRVFAQIPHGWGEAFVFIDTNTVVTLLCIALLVFIEAAIEFNLVPRLRERLYWRSFAYSFIFLAIIVFGAFQEKVFIYFQF